MNKELLLKLIGMPEEQVFHEVAKIDLNSKEYETFDKGKGFIDKYDELENEDSRKRVILELISYALKKKNGGK